MKFERGNHYAKLGGRPRGSRNQLDAYAYACALAHVQHRRGDPPPAEYEHTNLWKALDITLRESPRDYVARVISMLPKEVQFSSAVNELEDDELDRMITALRERVLAIAARDERDEVQIKLIEQKPHAH